MPNKRIPAVQQESWNGLLESLILQWKLIKPGARRSSLVVWSWGFCFYRGGYSTGELGKLSAGLGVRRLSPLCGFWNWASLMIGTWQTWIKRSPWNTWSTPSPCLQRGPGWCHTCLGGSPLAGYWEWAFEDGEAGWNWQIFFPINERGFHTATQLTSSYRKEKKPTASTVVLGYWSAFTHIAFAFLNSPHKIALSFLSPSWLPEIREVVFLQVGFAELQTLKWGLADRMPIKEGSWGQPC